MLGAALALRVTFAQDMGGGMSWCGGGPEFPEVTGQGNWISPRTCVLPVRLQPNHRYAMIPVGLDTIGSVVFEDKFKQVSSLNPAPVSKGERVGHFEYGGSLVITLIEQGINSVTIPQGQQIGVFAGKK